MIVLSKYIKNMMTNNTFSWNTVLQDNFIWHIPRDIWCYYNIIHINLITFVCFFLESLPGETCASNDQCITGYICTGPDNTCQKGRLAELVVYILGLCLVLVIFNDVFYIY